MLRRSLSNFRTTKVVISPERPRSLSRSYHLTSTMCKVYCHSYHLTSQCVRCTVRWRYCERTRSVQVVANASLLERLGESGATHDSQSASRSGVEAWVARNLNGWDDSDAGLSQGWVRCPSGLASLHHSRLSTRSSYQLYSFSGDRRFCYDNHGSFVYDSPNLFCGPSGLVRTGLTGVRSEPGPRTHLTSLLCKWTTGI